MKGKGWGHWKGEMIYADDVEAVEELNNCLDPWAKTNMLNIIAMHTWSYVLYTYHTLKHSYVCMLAVI